MSAQPTDSDTESPSEENGSTAYAELLSASNLEELEEKPWEVKLALLQHHLELARIFVNELLEEEVEEKAGERYSHDDSRFSQWGKNPGSSYRGGKGADYGASDDRHRHREDLFSRAVPRDEGTSSNDRKNAGGPSSWALAGRL